MNVEAGNAFLEDAAYYFIRSCSCLSSPLYLEECKTLQLIPKQYVIGVLIMVMIVL